MNPKRLVLLLGLVLAGLTLPAGAATPAMVAANEPIVLLPPFRVDEFSSYLGFTWNARLDKNKITSVRFSRVEPNSLASKAGLIAGDLLLAIDGHSVVGGEITDLQKLFARNWTPGDTLEWQFTVERGAFFSRQRTIFLRMRTKAPPPDAAAASSAK